MADDARIEVTRGPFVESRHIVSAVIADAAGAPMAVWGDPGQVILPRSSIKMIQALPLAESGAPGLDGARLALACASHQGAPMHTGAVRGWLSDLGLGEAALLCGPQPPGDRETRHALIRAGEAPGPVHNNCSGKHTGFLALARHLGAPAENYIAPDHPVQRAVRAAFEEVTGEESPGHATDGCSAPNFATSLAGLARAMAFFAVARAEAESARARAAARLVAAMAAHPEIVAGPGRACTDLIRAARGRAVVKTGAEGVYVAILPERRLGVALKVADGAARAAECAITALLVRLGALDPDDSVVARRLTAPIINRAGRHTGEVRWAADNAGMP